MMDNMHVRPVQCACDYKRCNQKDDPKLLATGSCGYECSSYHEVKLLHNCKEHSIHKEPSVRLGGLSALVRNYFYMLLLLSIACYVLPCSNGLHLQGSFNSEDFFVFLAKFGFQQTDPHDKENTQGYIFGNITSSSTRFLENEITLAVVDSEYFLEYYGNRTSGPKQSCPIMFKKIQTIAWDAKCHRIGKEDFLRRVPCTKNELCPDEDTPAHVVPGYQFTYAVEDTKQPRFWYVSFVSCHQNSTIEGRCNWIHTSEQTITIDYDIWLVNGSPYTKKFNPFEHQFSFENHDVFEIYLTFFLLYTFLVPIQLYAFSREKHMLPFILTLSVCFEYVGVFFNFIHIFKFALDGSGLELLKIIGNFIDQGSQCLFMLLLLLIVKGWTLSRRDHMTHAKYMIFAVWISYTIANLALFIWNLTAVDVISDIDEWQTLPGYLILTFRIGIMIWFLLELRDTFILERGPDKVRFYLHFGAGYLVWFVYLPIVAIIGTQLSALWRQKTILSVSYAADFISFAALIHLLWPSHSSLYFNLKLETKPFDTEAHANGDVQLEKVSQDFDTMSEDSFDIQETAMLIRQRNTTSSSVADKDNEDNFNSTESGYSSPQRVTSTGDASATTRGAPTLINGSAVKGAGQVRQGDVDEEASLITIEHVDSGIESIHCGSYHGSQESMHGSDHPTPMNHQYKQLSN